MRWRVYAAILTALLFFCGLLVSFGLGFGGGLSWFIYGLVFTTILTVIAAAMFIKQAKLPPSDKQ